MAKTLLEIVQQASGELGLGVPNAAASSTAQDVVQMVYLANALGEELLRKWDWQQLVKEYVFQTVASASTGDVTSGSAIITGIPSTTGLDTTYYVSAAGFPTGVTILSVASISSRPDPGTEPTATILPSLTTTSAWRAGCPDPSITLPLRITRS